MLKAIQLENFKCFEQTGLLPLAPITLIYGPNSAGKSSILQALYLLMQTRRLGEPEIPLLFSAENGLVDLGSFEETVYNHQKMRNISIRLDMPFSCPEYVSDSLKELFKRISGEKMGLKLVFSCDKENSDISLSEFGMYVDDDEDPITYYKIDEDAVVSQYSIQESILKNAKYWEYLYEKRTKLIEIIAEREKISDGTKDNSELLLIDLFENIINSNSIDEYLLILFNILKLQVFSGSNYYLPEDICIARMIQNQLSDDAIIALDTTDELNDEENHNIPTKIYDNIIKYPWTTAKAITKACAQQFDYAVENLRSTGSIHPIPKRWYTFSGAIPKNIGINGERVPEILFRNKEILDEVNRILDKVLDMGCYIEANKLNAKYGSMFELRVGTLKNKKAPTVSLADVGFGVGQILPLIIQGVLEQGKTILVEQPETHIHPALQARLGTFFAKCAKDKNNQFIIETHSEHLILRLQRLIRSKELESNEVTVLYVEPSDAKNGPRVREMRLDEQGEFLDDWPGGFFPERLREFLD